MDSSTNPIGKSEDKDTENDEGETRVVCGYPIATPFIIGNEFCERFSYYGLRTILVLYLKNFLGFDTDSSTVYYHVFVMLSYFTSIFGAMLADSKFGKFRTILYLSIVYCIGNVVMSVTAIPDVIGQPPTPAGAFVALLLISIGTGGIKPCVSAFGADQFPKSLSHKLQGFFAAFYLSINAGSVLSMLITPKLRADVECFGYEECYPLAFGVPAILMALALISFLIGTRYYVHKIPDRNVMMDFFKTCWIGMKSKCCGKSKGQEHRHWLDAASNRFGKEFVSDVKTLLSVLLIFLPTPLFWTLFDQQGSRWTLQAEQMKTFSMGPLGHFRPDQMQALNAICIILLIPVFEKMVYPMLKWMKIPARPLQRMALGMILCGVAFVVSGLVQLKIDAASSLPAIDKDQALARVINLGSQPIDIQLESTSTFAMIALHVNGSTTSELQVISTGSYISQTQNGSLSLNFDARYESVHSVVANFDLNPPLFQVLDDSFERDGDLSLARLRVFNLLSSSLSIGVFLDNELSSIISPANSSLIEIESGQVSLELRKMYNSTHFLKSFKNFTWDATDGSFQTLFLSEDSQGGGAEPQANLFSDVKGNSVTILWQIPQYVVISCGEILFSVTGLEFAYTEAPESMKAIVQSAWLLTTAFGSLVVIIVAEASFVSRQSDEFFLFSGLMGVVTVIFIFLAIRYSYRNPRNRRGFLSDSDSPAMEDNVPLMSGEQPESMLDFEIPRDSTV